MMISENSSFTLNDLFIREEARDPLIYNVFQHLDFEDAKELRQVSLATRQVVDTYTLDPEKGYNFKRRVEAFANKFQDRPLHEKVGIVSLVAITSPISVPIILVMKSPKIYLKYRDTHIIPFVNKTIEIANHILTICFITIPKDYLIIPLYNGSKYVLNLTYQNVLVPVGNGLLKAYNFTYENVLIPARNGLLKGYHFTLDNILSPLYKIISTIGEAVFITFPSKIYHHVLKPIGEFIYEKILTPLLSIIQTVVRTAFNKLVDGCFFVIEKVVYPILKLIGKIFKGIFTLSSKIIEHVIVPLCKEIVFPLISTIMTIAKALFITLPYKVYEHVLKPIYNNFIKPLSIAIKAVANVIFIKLLYQKMIVPVASLLMRGVKFSYQNVLSPTAVMIQFIVTKILFEAIPITVSAIWNPLAHLIFEVKDATFDLGRWTLNKIA